MRCRKTLTTGVGALALTLGTACLAQGSEDTTAHDRFACLQRERPLEELSAKRPEVSNNGLLRLKLRFERADRPPMVETLLESADDEMVRVARRYVSGFRLPCLVEGDKPIELVQEFSFARWGQETPVLLRDREPQKLRLKAAPMPDVPSHGFEPGKMLVRFTFQPGQDEPEVSTVFSGVNRSMKAAVEDTVRRYRLADDMPRPASGQRSFVFRYEGSNATQFRLRKDEFSLMEFLRITSNLREHLVDIDLDSLGCPFDVRLSLRQPYEANGVFEIGAHDPNRAYLLDWLSKLKVSFANEAQQMDLYETDVKLRIPCGRLDLTALKKPGS